MTTDELNAIVQAVMLELEKAGVDFDFKAETPQPTDLVYVMRGTADKYQGITVKWQNLLDIIVKKATDAKDEAVSAKDIALQTLATIQGIESNVSSMKSSVDESEANVASMKASVEASETRVTQIKAEAEQTLAEATQTVSGKADKTYVDGELAKKADITYVDGKLANKADKSELAVERARIDSLSRLSEGSTTGDAELIDLRIGADGVTYGNAGTAVRTQISNLKGDIAEISNTVFLGNGEKKIEWVTGFVNTGGNFGTSSKDKVLKPIPLYSGETVKVKTKGDGIYLFSAISKVPSENIPIAVGESGGTALVTLTDNTLTEYTYTATEDMFITVCVLNDDSSEVVFENLKKNSRIEENAKKIEDNTIRIEALEQGKAESVVPYDAVFKSTEKVLDWVVGFVNTGGNFGTSSKDKVLKPIPLYSGETVKVKTKGDGIYLFSAISKVPSENIPIAVGESGGTALVTLTDNTLTEYTYTATEDMFVTVCVLNDPTSIVEFENLKYINRIDILEDDVKTLSNKNAGTLNHKSVMFFGDSLMSASGVIGFAEIIANNYNMPIRKFIYDSADGNSQDVPVDYKCFTNYAKDGTMNRVISERKDSVLERVKRHITTDTDVDFVLIECCVNDMASSNRNKGVISDSYTEEYDISTTIGSIEETLRYLTTLGKPIKIGAFIPWLISWNTLGWFDDYVAVFEKWGVPVFDMRKCSGFNLYKCTKHILLYTLSSDSYETYDNTKTYNLDDKVKYQGTLYKCLANGVVGVLPIDTTKWMSVSSETADGTHLNNLGHQIVSGKIQNFIESL